MLSSLTKAHFFSVELFLQWSGLECLQPKVWVFVSASESGRLWSIFISVTFLFYNHLSLNNCPHLLCLVFTVLAQKTFENPETVSGIEVLYINCRKLGAHFAKIIWFPRTYNNPMPRYTLFRIPLPTKPFCNAPIHQKFYSLGKNKEHRRHQIGQN